MVFVLVNVIWVNKYTHHAMFVKKIAHYDGYSQLTNNNDWPRWPILNHLSFYIVPIFFVYG
jgi:hypothetical protein